MQLLFKNFSMTSTIDEQWIKENCYVAGGACVSYFNREKPRDIDIYFKTKEARDFFVEEVAEGNYYIGDEVYINREHIYWKLLCECNKLEINDDKEIIIGNSKYNIYASQSGIGKDVLFEIETITECGFCTEISISKKQFESLDWHFANGYDYMLLSHSHFVVDDDLCFGNKSISLMDKEKIGRPTYQFILRFYGEPQEMMDKTFDFECCKIAYDLKTNKFIAKDEVYQQLLRKRIKYVNSFYPISTLKRLFKYKNKGYYFDNDTYIAVLKDIKNLDLEDERTLADQLVGYYEDFDYDLVFKELPLDAIEW